MLHTYLAGAVILIQKVGPCCNTTVTFDTCWGLAKVRLAMLTLIPPLHSVRGLTQNTRVPECQIARVPECKLSRVPCARVIEY